jgi:hypothetical protein
MVLLLGCGDDGATVVQDAPAGDIDAPAQQQCLPQGAVGSFYRRPPNPRLIAGTHTFSDNKLDTAIADPNLTWDGTTWHLYYMSPHGTTFNPAGPQVIRHATSPDLSTWTLQDAPAFTVSASGWDSGNAETPSVVYNPDAPADRKYVLVYSGASGTFPHPNYPFPDYAIGAAFSADGNTFTRVSTNGGKVLDASAVYSASTDGVVADPDIIVVGGTYHMWFSSFGCSGSNCATVDRYGVADATSTDAITWTVQEAPVISLLATASMLTSGRSQPSVVYDELHCRYEMWMADQSGTDNQPVQFNNMTGVLHAKSANGTSWTVDAMRDLTWDSTKDGEALGLLTGADVAQKGTGRYMVYVGFDDQNVPANSFLPTANSFVSGVMTLNLATRDAPP